MFYYEREREIEREEREKRGRRERKSREGEGVHCSVENVLRINAMRGRKRVCSVKKSTCELKTNSSTTSHCSQTWRPSCLSWWVCTTTSVSCPQPAAGTSRTRWRCRRSSGRTTTTCVARSRTYRTKSPPRIPPPWSRPSSGSSRTSWR